MISGELSSSTYPLSMKMTLVETSRANAISCVTTIIVSPSFARIFMTESTSPTISGSSAEVGSSNSSTSGPIASARAIANALLLTAGQLTRSGVEVRLHADLAEILNGVFSCLFPVLFQYLHLTDHAVCKNRHICEKIERLKHHSDIGTVM